MVHTSTKKRRTFARNNQAWWLVRHNPRYSPPLNWWFATFMAFLKKMISIMFDIRSSANCHQQKTNCSNTLNGLITKLMYGTTTEIIWNCMDGTTASYIVCYWICCLRLQKKEIWRELLMSCFDHGTRLFRMWHYAHFRPLKKSKW